MKPANLKVKTWLDRHGFEFDITILPSAVRTVALAAAALDCAVGQTANPPRTIFDVSLQRHVAIWAAAGTSESVFCMSPQQLQLITAGAWLDITES